MRRPAWGHAAMSKRELLVQTIVGREAALAKATDKKAAKAIETELEELRDRLAAMPAEPKKEAAA